jgi:D-arabinose 1-dehydrogenase-like Zn-dependent alcohol dehydrogenase
MGGFAKFHRTKAAFAFDVPEGLKPAAVAPLLCAGMEKTSGDTEFSTQSFLQT